MYCAGLESFELSVELRGKAIPRQIEKVINVFPLFAVVSDPH